MTVCMSTRARFGGRTFTLAELVSPAGLWKPEFRSQLYKITTEGRGLPQLMPPGQGRIPGQLVAIEVLPMLR